MAINTVAVIGAGTMGLGIAQVAAMAGYKVLLFDTKSSVLAHAITQIEANLNKAISIGKLAEDQKLEALDNITTIISLDGLRAELVIEAIVEDLEIKLEVFQTLESVLPANALLCTNTSSIPVTKIAAGLDKPERLVGMHFFNPAHIMKLVEVVSTSITDPSYLKIALEFVESLKKVPVVAKDAPGFIVNRVARHFYVESLKLLEDGVANHEQIDKLVEASGFKMGPFRLMDLIGVDTNFAVTSTMYKGFHQDPKFRPSRIQEEMVNSGRHGRKSGRGFYSYE